MGSKGYDVIVVGLGAMGSATIKSLAAKGTHVLGIDRFDPPHTMGSSHGESRIIRQAYYEGEVYVPLLIRAYQLWKELEEESGQRLFEQTGGLMIGPNGSGVLEGSIRSAQRYHLDFEILDADQVRSLFPAFRMEESERALFEPKAGFVRPERTISANLRLAVQQGAEIHTGDQVIAIDYSSASLAIVTRHHRFEADRIVLTGGAWTNDLLPEQLRLPIEPVRTTVHWFAPKDHPLDFIAPTFPVFIREDTDGTETYGLPPSSPDAIEIKHGFHNRHLVRVNPEDVNRSIMQEDVESISRRTKKWFSNLEDGPSRSEVCLYSLSPDRHFLLGAQPADPRVVVAGGFSGHGFKFSPVIGEILGQLTVGEKPECDISPFSLSRFDST